uniref:Uncharacterized protein n=1 Tax=Fervidobacterium nodosum TaxID=2424 RepID=A0A7C5U5K9_9BACT
MKYRYVNRESEKQSLSTVYIFIDILNALVIFTNIGVITINGLRFSNIIVCFLSSFLYYLTRKNLSETILFLLSYPVAWLFLLPLRNEEIEDFFNVSIPPEITMRIDDSVMNVLPVRTLLIIGKPSEKKLLTRTIFTYVTKGIDVERNMRYLRILLKDPHMDVALYASQALEDIENYFEANISKTKEENSIKSCVYIYNYLRTGIPAGVIKEEFRNLLIRKLEKTTHRVPMYYEIMYYLKKDLDILLQGYQVTKSVELLRRYLIEKLRQRQYVELKSFLTTENKKLICKWKN